MNTPSYSVLQSKEKLIRTVQSLCQIVDKIEKAQSDFVTHEDMEESQVVVIAAQPIPTTWPTDSTHSMADLIDAINADETAVPGRMYLSTISLNDLPYYDDNGTPARLLQAEMKIEIMAREPIDANNIKDVILFVVTSSNAPYHWEYTSVWGSTGEWIAFEVAS